MYHILAGICRNIDVVGTFNVSYEGAYVMAADVTCTGKNVWQKKADDIVASDFVIYWLTDDWWQGWVMGAGQCNPYSVRTTEIFTCLYQYSILKRIKALHFTLNSSKISF